MKLYRVTYSQVHYLWCEDESEDKYWEKTKVRRQFAEETGISVLNIRGVRERKFNDNEEFYKNWKKNANKTIRPEGV